MMQRRTVLGGADVVHGAAAAATGRTRSPVLADNKVGSDTESALASPNEEQQCLRRWARAQVVLDLRAIG
jgi:hypothetical protein